LKFVVSEIAVAVKVVKFNGNGVSGAAVAKCFAAFAAQER
jgi:hypothetical protein